MISAGRSVNITVEQKAMFPMQNQDAKVCQGSMRWTVCSVAAVARFLLIGKRLQVFFQ